jgi:uncharacterized protein (DUF2384 family)
MGLGHARPVEALHGAVDSGYWISEENARTFLRRWRVLMETEPPATLGRSSAGGADA